jgi:hypothetical protein
MGVPSETQSDPSFCRVSGLSASGEASINLGRSLSSTYSARSFSLVAFKLWQVSQHFCARRESPVVFICKGVPGPKCSIKPLNISSLTLFIASKPMRGRLGMQTEKELKASDFRLKSSYAPVAQLDRASGFEPNKCVVAFRRNQLHPLVRGRRDVALSVTDFKVRTLRQYATIHG